MMMKILHEWCHKESVVTKSICSICQPTSWKKLESYNYNKEEINQVCFSIMFLSYCKLSFPAFIDSLENIVLLEKELVISPMSRY